MRWTTSPLVVVVVGCMWVVVVVVDALSLGGGAPCRRRRRSSSGRSRPTQSSSSSSPKQRQRQPQGSSVDPTTSTTPSRQRRVLWQQSMFAAAAYSTMLLTTTKKDAAVAGSLLDDFGTDPSRIVQAEPTRHVGSTSASTSSASASAASSTAKKGEAAIDPTLRASYYYPTAKKRYLPRILKVSNAIGPVAASIEQDEWTLVEEFFKDADNAVLPMKLYVSSLDGQGLGMSNSYANQMKQQSRVYESQVALLKKAMNSQNKHGALEAVQTMGVAIAQYRQVGRLTDDDGNIPSVDEIRRLAIRNRGIGVP